MTLIPQWKMDNFVSGEGNKGQKLLNIAVKPAVFMITVMKSATKSVAKSMKSAAKST